ncbi:LysR family transcriptional regulator [Zoogloea sp.]|uniref:LysR family transcriptional regulator n=1 Tax=Zoogloea sp. TaxID=49181 RepID=UPI0035ADCC86
MNWDDLRVLVEIGRAGSIAGAARRLKLDQTTVARRLRALEDRLGVRVFGRGASGRWQPTAVGLRVLERAARVEEDVAGLLRVADAAHPEIAGSVRITSVGSILAHWITPRLPALLDRHPGLAVELVASNDNLSVSRREADIAIRLARPEHGDFLIRKLADVGFAVYAPAAGTPPDAWVCYDDDLAHTPEMRWLAPHLATGRVRLRSNEVDCLVRAVAAGIGQAVLPCFIADPNPALQRQRAPAPAVTRELWLLIHPDARQQPRVVAVADWLAAQFADNRGAFLGQP